MEETKHLTPPPNIGLGRLPSADERDKGFMLKSLVPSKAPDRTSRYWNTMGWWGNQHQLPQCVAFAWTHWIEDGPVTHKGTPPIINPPDLYAEAQRIDEWPGEDYAGTSVRAGAKVLQSKGLIASYLWAWDLDTLINTVLSVGPVVIGTNWYMDMFYPDKNGVITPGGSVAGGHAYVINGINTKTKMFRVKNSWGRTWGRRGLASISFADIDRLMNENGEICYAIENKLPADL